MASNRGTATSGNVVQLNNKLDVSSLYELEGEATPLVVLTQKLKKVRTVDNPQFYNISLRPLAQSSLCSSYLVGASSITVVDSTIYNVNDRIVNLRTFENMLITAIDYGTHALTVTRAIGSTVAAAGNNNDTILRLGQALPEASSMPTAVLNQEETLYNYTQIFRESYQISGTMKAVATYTGDEVKKRIRQCVRKVKGDMEFSAFFGERGIQNSSTTPRRFTAGLRAAISTNSYVPNASITYDQWVENVLIPAGRYGSSTKILIAGETIMRCLDKWGNDKLQLMREDTSLGFKAKLVQSSFVDLIVVRHPLFRGSALANKGFIVDPENMHRVVLRGRDMVWQRDIQANDLDGEYGSILAEIGWEFPLEETHMSLDGINGTA